MDPGREAYWARRLRPIHPGPGPAVEAQLAQRRRGTVVVSALVLMIGLIILAIFAAFGRADVGLSVFGVECLPATVLCWLDLLGLRNRARAFLRERDEPGA